MPVGSHTFSGCLSGHLAGEEGVAPVKFQTIPISKCVTGGTGGPRAITDTLHCLLLCFL